MDYRRADHPPIHSSIHPSQESLSHLLIDLPLPFCCLGRLDPPLLERLELERLELVYLLRIDQSGLN